MNTLSVNSKTKLDKYYNTAAFNKRVKTISAKKTAKKILTEIMMFRRMSESTSSCRNIDCTKCASPHLPKIICAVESNKPVVFVLPAFPGKSPNYEKVLSPLPDMAERLSLRFLGSLCQRIKKIYTPGIKIILCSDGRVFSDVVGIKEKNVSAYQAELNKLKADMSLSDISTFNLEDFFKSHNFVQIRAKLMKLHGTSLDFLKQKIRNGAQPSAKLDEKEANRMYTGITRFLFEDAAHNSQIKSRTAIQKESRIKAYEVIRRSNAWSQLIAKHFPKAVRLSIHPQICGSKKLGICLIGNDSWMTPWHGVAVESSRGFILLKRYEAEAMGATLVYFSDGRCSHYTLPKELAHEF